MKNRICMVCFVIMVNFVCSCVPDDCIITDTSPTEGRIYNCFGYSFIVSVPDTCQDGGCGLIVDVHGLFNSPDKQEKNTKLRELGRNAMDRGAISPYIVVQPNAKNNLTGWSESDAPYVHDLVKKIAETWMVDDTRIHFTGFSQGGGMTMWAICNHRDFYASFAPVSAGDDHLCFEDIENLPETAILHIIGENDPWAWPGALKYKHSILTAMVPYFEEVIDSGSGYTRTRYSGNGMQYDWLPHCGDHCILGGDSDACDCECDITHGEAILDFFIDHPKQ